MVRLFSGGRARTTSTPPRARTAGGRQSYVVDATGTIQSIHNNQFDPESHVTVALEAAKELPSASPFPFELPDFSSLFAGSKEE